MGAGWRDGQNPTDPPHPHPQETLRFCQGMGWEKQMERPGRYLRNQKLKEEEEGGGDTSTSRWLSPLVLHLLSLGGLKRGWEGQKGNPPSVLPEADFCEPAWVPPFLDLSGDLEESEALQAPSFFSILDRSYSPISSHSSLPGLFLFIPAHSSVPRPLPHNHLSFRSLILLLPLLHFSFPSSALPSLISFPPVRDHTVPVSSESDTWPYTLRRFPPILLFRS